LIFGRWGVREISAKTDEFLLKIAKGDRVTNRYRRDWDELGRAALPDGGADRRESLSSTQADANWGIGLALGNITEFYYTHEGKRVGTPQMGHSADFFTVSPTVFA